MRRKKTLLSVVVPAYKQERTIKKDLKSIVRVLDEGLGGDYNYEIICVVDGEIDGTLKEALKVKLPRLKVYSYHENRGKGYAVRYGMERSKGDLISFLDAGMDISPKGIMMLLAHMDWYNADIIVGSKRHPVSRVNYSFLRKVFSYGYHLGIRILFGLRLSDTQSGIKILKRKVVEKIIPRLLVKRYAMDVEMLAVAHYLSFKRIYEGPIEVHFNKASSKIRLRDGLLAIWDTLAVFYRLKILRYYDDKNRKNWLTG